MHQGPRPNYQSSIAPLTYKPRAFNPEEHETFLGNALYDLSEITERASPLFPLTLRRQTNSPPAAVDFEQPRVLWQKVFDDGAKERFVNNVAGHLKDAVGHVQARQRTSLFAFLSLHPFPSY